MKLLVSCITIVVLLLGFYDSYNNDLQPPAAKTGAPGEGTCGDSNCHNNTPNSGPGNVTLTFSDPNLTYVPGDTFQITVKVTDNTKTKWGFELTALNATNDSTPGKFLGEASGIIVSYPVSSALNKRKYVAHRDANNTVNTWTLLWVAPATDVGTICFYAAANAANNNGNTGGDNIYKTSLCISASPVSVHLPSTGNAASFSVRSDGFGSLYVAYEKTVADVTSIVLYDLEGRQQQLLFSQYESAGSHTHKLRLGHVRAAGIYVLEWRSGSGRAAQKLYIAVND